MKLTTKQLKQIIKEEIRNIVAEMDESYSSVKRAPFGYSLWDGQTFHKLPMDMPEGIPAKHMQKLTQVALEDPKEAALLGSSFGGDLQEITDFFYDVAIAELTKDRAYDVQIDETDPFYHIVIYEDLDGDGALLPVGEFEKGTSKEEVYDSLKMFKQGNY